MPLRKEIAAHGAAQLFQIFQTSGDLTAATKALQDFMDRETAGLFERIEVLEAEVEQERVRLAGCGVAALGYAKAQDVPVGTYGYSASLADVMRLRAEADGLRDTVQEACRYLREGKERWAPNTTNSHVDEFLKRHERATDAV